jgi:hypothetical protein
MAQGRRFSGQNRVAGDHSHNDFWGRESILEVGGAYLFETPQQSGVRKMPELKDAINDRECGNTYYQQNTSCRRQPRTDNVKA